MKGLKGLRDTAMRKIHGDTRTSHPHLYYTKKSKAHPMNNLDIDAILAGVPRYAGAKGTPTLTNKVFYEILEPINDAMLRVYIDAPANAALVQVLAKALDKCDEVLAVTRDEQSEGRREAREALAQYQASRDA